MPDETTVAGTMNRHFVYIFKKLKQKKKKKNRKETERKELTFSEMLDGCKYQKHR